jgi:hypothetical protein
MTEPHWKKTKDPVLYAEEWTFKLSSGSFARLNSYRRGGPWYLTIRHVGRSDNCATFNTLRAAKRLAKSHLHTSLNVYKRALEDDISEMRNLRNR